MHPATSLAIAAIVLLGSAAPRAAVGAPEIYAGASLGVADPSRGGYRDATTWHAHAGLRFGDLAVELGYIDPEELDLRGNADTFIDIDGYSLSAHYSLPIGRLRLALGAGLYAWEAEAVLADRRVGDDTGSSPLLRARARLPLGRVFSFTAGWTHLDDVSGADLDLYELGVRFDF